MYKKEHLLVAKIASKNSLKKELNCIAYRGDKVVATDSFRMMEVPVEDGVALEKPDLRIASSAKMPAGYLMVDEPLGLELKDADKYPDTDVVMKSSAEGEFVTFNVNGKLFGELLMQMAKLNNFGQVTVKVPTTPYKAIMLESKFGDLTAKGLMMPMNR